MENSMKIINTFFESFPYFIQTRCVLKTGLIKLKCSRYDLDTIVVVVVIVVGVVVVVHWDLSLDHLYAQTVPV